MKDMQVLTVYSKSNSGLYSVKRDKDSYYIRKHTYKDGRYTSSGWTLTSKDSLLNLGLFN